MVDFAKLNRRIAIIDKTIDTIDDIKQIESDKLILKWLEEIKTNLKSIR